MSFESFEDFEITGQSIDLEDFPCSVHNDEEDEKVKDELFNTWVPQMAELHQKLFAEEKSGIIVVLQALDAAGKDEIIEYIFSSLIPQSIKVTSFQQPTDEEKSHDFLWRMSKGMPERGELAILNRSYYEDIIAPVVHDSLEDSKLPEEIKKNEDILEKRIQQLKNYEKYLSENGFPVVKFFFNLSKDKQAERLIERIENPEKNYEFSPSDIDDRKKWDQYQYIFNYMLNHTASEYAPWYILPADNPWLARKIATLAIIKTLEALDPHYPEFTEEEKEEAEKIAEQLKNGEL